MNGWIAKYLAKPHLVLSLILLMAIIGIIGYFKLPINLYPDSDHPQITVITVEPGAAAADVEAKVSRAIEKELATLGNVLRVSSTSKDEVSVVNVEFDYQKSLDSAATDVADSLNKITGQLPGDIRTPQINKISQASQPTVVLALSPRPDSLLNMVQIRQLAENEIKEELLRVPGIAQTEVFGGYQPELSIAINPDALARYGLTIGDVAAALNANNVNVPNGLIIKQGSQFLLKTQGEFKKPADATNIIVAHRQNGDIYLRDVAQVKFGMAEPQSAYRGNGQQAVGMSILRAPTGVTMDGVNAMEQYLPTLRSHYPDITFEISDTQGSLIRGGVDNMRDALRDAILLTVLVVFLFLGNLRITMLAAISIPFTYLITFAVMWLMGYEFNMVTLTGIIVAVGMLLDDAIVVLENIARHYEEYPGKLQEAVVGGTEEVMLAIFSGTYATAMVLAPIIFIGGYVQTVMRPMALSLSIALVASYIVSVTVIPIAAPLLLKAKYKSNVLERLALRFDNTIIGSIRDFFVTVVGIALKHRLVFLLIGIMAFGVSIRQMPLIGRDLMSSMDTGIIKIDFETDTDTSLAETNRIAKQMEAFVGQTPGLESISTVIGSESGIVSFGSGKLPQSGNMTIRLVDRFHRPEPIWQIEENLRQKFSTIPGLKYVNVYDFGATPMASIKAPVDVMVSGPDRAILNQVGEEIYQKMLEVPGLTTVSRSWSYDKKEVIFTANKERCALYEISPLAVSRQIAEAVRGTAASVYRIDQEDGIGFRVQYPEEKRDDAGKLKEMLINTAKGPIPLESLGSLTYKSSPTLFTRQALQNTVDIYGYREQAAITHLDEGVQKALSDIKLPAGYSLSQEGDLKQMTSSFGALGAAMGIGLILLYFSLVPAFDSFMHPLTIMSAIPLGVIGAAWSLLAAGKHSSMPAFMGMILLAGIVVKNSILLIDFIIEARAKGSAVEQAIIDSVRMRTRPILMTACGTAVGMVPIALEWAVGLERLSPLAVVAIGGLMVSTFLTLIYVPILFTLFEDAKHMFKNRFPVEKKDFSA
ncbi:efflux RND transporter permease subunit [Pelosinus sp. IPA-1]|uniref:efflux RND transporter permease subunit n=1 Tax=Pelosinus sp. IPA-1 TaxID=3029569 RepID=UPI0024362A60|nr:efflux RND transporter permease subunit [Pelosinus sp. IPA-1]GMB00998.1 multidrug ABC transporter [Pelosinus sp. IPA-1]